MLMYNISVTVSLIALLGNIRLSITGIVPYKQYRTGLTHLYSMLMAYIPINSRGGVGTTHVHAQMHARHTEESNKTHT